MTCQRRKDERGDWICDRCESLWTELLDETGWRPAECPALVPSHTATNMKPGGGSGWQGMYTEQDYEREIDRLRSALKPFAYYYDLNDCQEREKIPDNALEVPIADLRAAKAALTPR